MGSTSIEVLYQLITEGSLPEQIYGTNVVTDIQVPLVLPELTVDDNLIGDLRYVGFILFGMAAITSLYFAFLTFRYRNMHVVRVSQPIFLIMIATGGAHHGQ
jgi:gamma-aminobutyric acid type B receptor